MKKSRNVLRKETKGEKEKEKSSRQRKLLPKVVGEHNRASKRASTCCPRAGAASVRPLLLSLCNLLTASGWGCWRESKWNSKWKNVSRFAAQAALKEIIFSYKQTHTRTDKHTHSTHTHTHALNTHTHWHTHITHTPRSTNSTLCCWQHIQSG